ncbi:MAG: radical SAM protein [Desulfobacterium sp.]|nr:radical SAM protein [Desulfobacterium sp.]
MTDQRPATPHVLCVNPWIHDFAAFDFWAKPLGLLTLAAILRKNRIRVTFMDCLDRFHPRAGSGTRTYPDGRGPYRKTQIPKPAVLNEEGPGRYSRYGIDPEWFRADLRQLDRPDIVLVTSLMTYWAGGVRETIAVIKEIFPETPVVLGGIYATLMTDHAVALSLADEVIPGAGEQKIQEIVRRHTGFSFTSNPTLDDPNDLDSLPLPALDLVTNLTHVPLLTTRGCPFACEYCASSFLEPRFRRRSPKSIVQEIRHWHNLRGVKNFAFYDDALLIDSATHAIPLFKAIISSNMNLAFHTPNALHIREITQQTAALMFKAGFKSIRLGLETTDFSRTGRLDRKVGANEFHRAVTLLKNAGFKRGQIGAYLLCGLPDQKKEDVEHSILEVKKSGITPVLAFYTPIPHTPMWERAKKASRFDLDKDPVFSNNALFPCFTETMSMKIISQLKKMTK